MSNQIKVLGAVSAAVASASSALAAPANYGYHGRAYAIEPFSDPLRIERPYRLPYTGYSERDFQVQVPGN
jgi:hypothetical protein